MKCVHICLYSNVPSVCPAALQVFKTADVHLSSSRLRVGNEYHYVFIASKAGRKELILIVLDLVSKPLVVVCPGDSTVF